jgi:fatty-acyl-CoA synthase
MKLGAVHVGVSTRFRSRELKFMLQNTRTSTLLIAEQYDGFNYLELIKEVRQDTPLLKNIIVVNGRPEDGMMSFDRLIEAGKNKKYPKPEIDPQKDLATLVYTSGTTGFPKGAMHTHSGFFGAAGLCVGRAEKLNSQDVVLGHIPMTVMFGAVILCAAFYARAGLVLIDTYDPKLVLELIEKEKVTEHSGTPAMFIMEMNHPDFKNYDITSLKVGIAAGAFFPTELVKKADKEMGLKLVQALGTSETVACALGSIEDSLDSRAETLGAPMPGSEIKVIDDSGKELPLGEAGELHYRGWNLCQGYWENPAENEKAFDDDGWWHTGDLVKIDEKGHLRILGRKKELIIRGGFNIVPSEIEELLSKHPKILEIAVVGTPNPVLGESICVCVIPPKGQRPTLLELRDFLKDKIADYKLPDELAIMEIFPYLANGKLAKFGPEGLESLAKADETREKLINIKSKKKQ